MEQGLISAGKEVKNAQKWNDTMERGKRKIQAGAFIDCCTLPFEITINSSSNTSSAHTHYDAHTIPHRHPCKCVYVKRRREHVGRWCGKKSKYIMHAPSSPRVKSHMHISLFTWQPEPVANQNDHPTTLCQINYFLFNCFFPYSEDSKTSGFF